MRTIYNELRLSGFRVWIDDHLKPGAPSWQQEINQMLDTAACVICICSPHAYSSKWVNIELRLAEQKHLRIYPVIVRGSEEKAIPLSLTNVQFTDCRREYLATIKKLTTELIRSHEEALMADAQTILSEDGINWMNFASLFWFASEVRKLRLFVLPESPTNERVRNSLVQLFHHAKRLNVDKFTLRDIEDVIKTVDQSTVEHLGLEDRRYVENKLRLVQDKVAGLAEKADTSFQDGPSPGNPLNLLNV